MKAIVTGGAGFIGSNLVDSLRSKGVEVLIIDNLSTGFLRNIPDGVELLEGDVGDPSLWEGLGSADYLFHLAAMTSVVESQTDPIRCEISNVHSIIHMIEYAKRQGVKKILFASSAAIYGDGADIQREDQLPQPKSPYGLSKLSGEHLLNMNYLEHSIPFVAFRMFNVFGPRQSVESSYASVIPIFFHLALTGRDLWVHGDGRQTRDFVYVKQVVRYYLQAMEGDMCGVFNLGSGSSRDILSLAEEVLSLSPGSVKLNFNPPRPGDIRHSKADTSRLRKSFGWEETDFQEALEKTHDYYQGFLGVNA